MYLLTLSYLFSFCFKSKQRFFCCDKNGLIPEAGVITRPPGTTFAKESNGADGRLRHITSVLAAVYPLFLSSRVARATKGAFEMDAEFYLQNLVNGDLANIIVDKHPRRQIFPSQKKPLDTVFTTAVLDIVQFDIAIIAKISRDEITRNVTASMPDLYALYSKNAPLEVDYKNKYYVDLVLLLSYRQAEDALSSSFDRVRLRRRVGEDILNYLEKTYSDRFAQLNDEAKPSPLMKLSGGIRLILDIFTNSGFISSFLYDEDSDMVEDEESLYRSFNDGSSLDFQITLKDPINIVSFIAQNKADTFFHPEVIATTISAWVRKCGFSLRYDDYLLDNFYRESNFDVQAQDVLVEVSLMPTDIVKRDAIAGFDL